MNLKQFFVGRAAVFALLIIGLGIALGFFVLNDYIYDEKQVYTATELKDAEYIIDGQRVRLVNGVAESESAPGSESKIVTRYFGNDVTIDLDRDGREDKVFLLTQETGGSGAYFYVVAALNTPNGYVGSEAFFVGDRIAPQTTEKVGDGNVVVNYADRLPGESFAVRPSQGMSLRLVFDPVSMRFTRI